MNKKEYDRIHIHALWNFPTLVACIKNLGKITIFSLHGTLRPFTFIGRETKRKIFSLLFQKNILKRASFIHGFSEAEKNDIINYLGGSFKTAIIPNGVGDLDYKTSVKINFTGKFLFMSRLDPIKGLDILLPAFRKALLVYPHFKLTIAGPDYGMKAYVIDFIEKNKLENSISYIGSISGDTKRKTILENDVYVLTSYSEGFSIAVLEAMQHGLPVLVSTEIGFPEVITNKNAGVVSNLSQKDVLNSLLTFETNKQDYANKSQNAMNIIASDFNIDVINKKIMGLYDVILLLMF